MDFLVKLSRNQKVMVPIVIVLGLGIMGSGYVITHQHKLAREQQEQAAQEAQSQQVSDNGDLQTQDTAQKEPEPINSDTPVSSDVNGQGVGSDLTGNSVPIEVEVENEDHGTFIHVKPHDAKQGVCKLYVNGQQRDQVNTKDNECTFEYKAQEGDGNLQVTYQSDDQSMSGVQNVTL